MWFRWWFLTTLAACAHVPPPEMELAQTAWRVVAFYQGDAAIPVPSWETLSLRFMDDHSVQGRADCNAFGGYYRQEGKRIAFQHLAGTKKGCGRSSHGTLFLNALRRVSRFERHGKRLTLFAPGLRIEMERIP